MAKLIKRSDGTIVKTGRNTKCTPDLIEAFGKAIEEVFYITTASNLLKIHPQSATKWIKAGQDHEKEFHPDFGDCTDECDPDQAAFRLFFITTYTAQAKFNQEGLQNIKKAGKSSRYWMANAWVLERTQPDKFGMRTRSDIKVSGTVNHKHTFNPEQRLRALKAASAALELEGETIETTQDESGTFIPVQDE
jgi:hypothetical protein